MIKKWLAGVLGAATVLTATAQSPGPDSDSAVIRRMFNETLLNGKSFEMLGELCRTAPARISGSENAQKAVDWAFATMKNLGFDTVFLQPCMVPHWVRGEKEEAKIISKKNSVKVNICALGGSIGTGKKGIRAGVIEVKSLDELKSLGKEKINGKIVFFNRPMDATHIHTFHAYGGCVDQRVWGTKEAVKYGAVGVIVRSMSLKTDEFPHTGVMIYDDSLPKIPAAAISTLHANQLALMLQSEPNIEFYFKQTSETLNDVPSFNVIGEIRGTELPDEYVIAGGHLDAWDNGEGAHDDGAGCVQSIEALRVFKSLGIRPKRSIRAVLFMNEENGLRGALEYARVADSLEVKHIGAIESDRGGFSPRGFYLDAPETSLEKVKSWKPLLLPYGLYDIERGGSGADIYPLKKGQENVVLAGLIPDSQRYFDFHHANTDRFENVHKRELELGAASMAALLYLMSQYGF